jgi:hypothetical protein
VLRIPERRQETGTYVEDAYFQLDLLEPSGKDCNPNYDHHLLVYFLCEFV